jgi:hypothetical protein
MSLADRRGRHGAADSSHVDDVESASRDVPHARDVDLPASAEGLVRAAWFVRAALN